MEKEDILGRMGHTLLKQTTTREQIKTLCREGTEHAIASVCIPPCYVKCVKEHAGENLAICTVIGFSNGNMTTVTKVSETEDVVRGGADEINMVINIGIVKEGLYEQVLKEIRQTETACIGKCLKVITETYLLTEGEKEEMCRVAMQPGTDYIKTSTDFSTGGTTREGAALLREHSGPRAKVRAASGIVSLQGVEDFIALEADRPGTSRLIPQRYGMYRNVEYVEI